MTAKVNHECPHSLSQSCSAESSLSSLSSSGPKEEEEEVGNAVESSSKTRKHLVSTGYSPYELLNISGPRLSLRVEFKLVSSINCNVSSRAPTPSSPPQQCLLHEECSANPATCKCHSSHGGALVLMGTNGSGKTTFLLMLAGFSKPSAGQVLWNGHGITDSGATHMPIEIEDATYLRLPARFPRRMTLVDMLDRSDF